MKRASLFTVADLSRALKAVAQSGMRMAVEITPTGTIRLVPMHAGPAEPGQSTSDSIKRKIPL
jgi:hypothetical protein